MRFTACSLVAVCLVFLSGCPTKSSLDTFKESKQSQPHSIVLRFTGNFCRARFIQNDLIKYEFTKPGTYIISPGRYLFIGECPNGNMVVPDANYTAGDTTELTFSPGTASSPHQPGTISGPLR